MSSSCSTSRQNFQVLSPWNVHDGWRYLDIGITTLIQEKQYLSVLYTSDGNFSLSARAVKTVQKRSLQI